LHLHCYERRQGQSTPAYTTSIPRSTTLVSSGHRTSQEAPSVHEEGGSRTPGASDKSGELLPLPWTWTHKARSCWAPETWTSRIPIMPGPRLPIAHRESLARQTKARFQCRLAFLTPLAKIAAAKLLRKSALSLHPELYCWIGLVSELEQPIYEG
jgi:hypothetical protein